MYSISQIIPRDGCKDCMFFRHIECLAFNTSIWFNREGQQVRCTECKELLTEINYSSDDVYAVQGMSMYPALQPYDILLYHKVPATELISEGTIVILRPPYAEYDVVKRIYTGMIDSEGKVWYYVLGDNSSSSTDSRNYGYVPAESVYGAVYKTIRPDKRMHPNKED